MIPSSAANTAPDSRVSQVEERSGAFRKELGLTDLVLAQVLYVVGSAWVGTAARLGPAHIIFWLFALVLFYLPQAVVVIYLNRCMPLEGGLYQWASAGLGRFLGFLVAWNLWAYTVLIMATFAVIVAANLSYLLGPGAASFTGSAWYRFGVTVILISGITTVSLLGLRTGKWFQNVGGAAQLLTFAGLTLVPLVALHRGLIGSYHPMAAALPTFTALNLNIFGKLALGALSGFEYVAILAGECRDPARAIGKSVLLAAPLIAGMFILGTSSVLALVPTDKIDLVSPIPQTLTIGFQGLAFAHIIVPTLILLLLLRQLGNLTLIFAGNSRLPLVAGWDGLLPQWFTRLDPRFRTPRNSILFVGGLTLFLSLAGQAGVGVQEAFQLLDNAAGILYAFAYLAMFAIPLVASSRLGAPAPFWLRAAALAGFAVTLLYCGLSVFPIIDVASWQVFTAKILAVLVGANLVGLAIYRLGKTARTSPPVPALAP
jgi:amino acid transporter